MYSETAIREELEAVRKDLQDWQYKFDRCRDNDQRRIIGNTICGVEGRIEALEWVLGGK